MLGITHWLPLGTIMALLSGSRQGQLDFPKKVFFLKTAKAESCGAERPKLASVVSPMRDT